MAKTLESLSIIRATEGYVLQMEDEDGDLREFSISCDQLGMIAAEIDRQFIIEEEDALVLEEDMLPAGARA